MIVASMGFLNHSTARPPMAVGRWQTPGVAGLPGLCWIHVGRIDTGLGGRHTTFATHWSCGPKDGAARHAVPVAQDRDDPRPMDARPPASMARPLWVAVSTTGGRRTRSPEPRPDRLAVAGQGVRWRSSVTGAVLRHAVMTAAIYGDDAAISKAGTAAAITGARPARRGGRSRGPRHRPDK